VSRISDIELARGGVCSRGFGAGDHGCLRWSEDSTIDGASGHALQNNGRSPDSIQLENAIEVSMSIAGAAERIAAAMSRLPGVTAGPHRFGGTEYRMGRREIGHVHGDALVDIPFPKKVREELVAAGKAEHHHILPDSGWVSVWLREAADVERAVELLRMSFERANLTVPQP
jgi:hypothetical protein